MFLCVRRKKNKEVLYNVWLETTTDPDLARERLQRDRATLVHKL